MADALSLLFELDTDPAKSIAGFRRARVEFAREIAAMRKLATQAFTLPSIKLPATATPASSRASGKQADDHVKEFRRIEAEAKKSAKAQEREQARLNSAVQSLQRQRSAAIIAGFKAEERAAIASARAQERAAQQAARSITNTFRGIGSGLQSIGRTLTIGITAPLLALGAASLKSAKDIDANVNTLKAFIGSAEAAERRLAQLIKTSRATPGLTTNLALTLDAQLRTAQVVEETIDRVLPAIGRLNAVSKLPDVGRFTQNLVQLVTQNFEKQDLKELVGQSPIAGQLITEIFNVDSPTNAKAIRESAKKLGIHSVDAFFTAFAEAAAKNQGLATVTESIGTRFDKLIDRVSIALRPLGLAIINAIEPFIEPVAKVIERIGAAFDSLSTPVKTAIVVIAAIAAALGPALIVLGSIVTSITAIIVAVKAVAAVVAAVGLPVIIAVIAAILVEIGKWVAILGVLGLAWKTNFLNIRGLVTDAARAVVEALGRIRAIILEATERILPTLQSITGKVLAVVTLIWERYGKTVVEIVGKSFAFITRVTEEFLKTFADFIDLVLKLIDSDWKGSWQAFARIVERAVEAIGLVVNNASRILTQAFQRLVQLVIAQNIKFLVLGTQLGTRIIAGLVAAIINGAKRVRSSLENMLIDAVLGIDLTGLVAVLAAKILDAIKRAADESRRSLNRDEPFAGGGTGGSFDKPKPKPRPSSEDKDKGADAETRRRIRLLELEAERAEAIARQGIAAENILFEQRRTSLKEFTDFQLHEEELVLAKKKAVFAAERVEAEKLTKGRDLALGEIRLKELKADLDFADRKNQLLANQQREELEAAKAHRQALLDIQETADAAQLARIEDFQRQGHVTAFDVASRRAEIEKVARARRREELQLQLKEAGKNEKDRERLLDEIKKFDDESAESVKRNERLKREAIRETADAYRDYTLAINEALEVAADARRNAAVIALSRLNARAFLTERQRIERQFAIDKSLLLAEKRASDLRIDNAEREAIEKAKRSGDFEEKVLQIERTFHDLRLAEQKRFEQERKKLDEDKKAALERADPSSGRSLFGDVFADTAEATGSALQGLLATGQDVFAQLSAQAGNMRDVMVSAFSAIGDAIGQTIQNLVLYGNLGGVSARKAAAGILAAVAAQAGVKALFEVAEGIVELAKAAANPLTAAQHIASAHLHFAAAKAYGIIGLVSGIAGRAVAGGSLRDNQGTASAAVNGGEPQPNNRNFDSSGQGTVEASSRAAREGSGGGFLGGVVARLEGLQQQSLEMQRQQMLVQGQTAQALTRIQSMRHGDALAIGTAENPGAVGRAVINHSNSDGEFNESMQRNLGFAR